MGNTVDMKQWKKKKEIVTQVWQCTCGSYQFRINRKDEKYWLACADCEMVPEYFVLTATNPYRVV